MRKIFLLNLFLSSLLFVGFVSCDDDEEEKNIQGLSSGERNQVLGADELGAEVSFTATAPWHTEITDDYQQSRMIMSNTQYWIEIDPASGDAGNHTIVITLLPNTDESARSATIIIVCEGQRVEIIIKQKGTLDDEGENPDEKHIYRITKINDKEVYYDEDGRMIGWGDEMYEETYLVKHLGNFGFAYIEERNGYQGRYDYSYTGEENRHIYEIYYRPRYNNDSRFESFYKWGESDLVTVYGDQVGVSREGYLATDIRYEGGVENLSEDLDVAFLLAGREYYVGPPMYVAFNNGAKSSHLPTSIIQADSDGKYNSTRNYRYEFDDEMHKLVTAIYCTEKYDIESAARTEERVYWFEYEKIN